MTKEQRDLIEKSLSRSNLTRVEQRRVGMELKNALHLCEHQAKIVRELRDEIINLKIQRKKHES